MSELSTFAAIFELYANAFALFSDKFIISDQFKICSGVFNEVLPFPPQIKTPKFLSEPRIASFNAAVKIVVKPEAFQSKAKTVPSD